MNAKLQGKGIESREALYKKKKKSRNMCKETCSECIQNKSLAAVNSFNPRRGIMSKSELFQKPIFGS